MTRTISLITSSVLASVWVQAAELPLENYLYEEMDMVLTLENLSELDAALESHPFAVLAKSPEMQRFIETLAGNSETEEDSGFFETIESRFGLSKDAFYALFPGQFAIGSDGILADEVPDSDIEEGLIILAEFSGTDERLNELMNIQFEYNANVQKKVIPEMEHTLLEETFLGETVYYDEAFNGEITYIEDGYALVDGVFILAKTQLQMERTIEAIKSGGENSVAQLPYYERSFDRDRSEDFRFFINMRDLLEPVIAYAQTAQASPEMSKLGLSPKLLVDALGFAEFESIAMSATLKPDGLRLDGSILYEEKVGLLSLITYGDDLIPEGFVVPEDAIASSLATFDLSEMFRSLEAIFAQASPLWAQMANLQLNNMKSTTGVDLKSAILHNFGETLISYTMPPDETLEAGVSSEVSEVLVADIKDTALFAQGLDAVFAQIPGLNALLTKESYAGQEITSYRAPQDMSGAETWSFALTRSQLVVAVGPLKNIKAALDNLESLPKRSLWEQFELLDALERIKGDDVVARSYSDMEAVFEANLSDLEMLKQLNTLMNGVDFKALREIELPFISITETSESADGISFRALIIEKEAL